MSTRISKAILELVIDELGFGRSLDGVERRVDAFGKNLAASSATFKKFGQQLQSAGASLTASLTVPIVGLGAAAIHSGLEFEKAMNAIEGVLQPTASQMEDVRKTAIKMGADTVFSATDAATAMLELGKAGFTTEQSMAAVGDVLQLAAASGLSMGEAAELSARTVAAFGLEITDLAHVNDVLAKSVNTSTLEVEDLRTAFKYVGPIAQGFGVSIEEATAALATMRDQGIAAETSGRALREGMSRLANPVKAVREVLGDLGINLRQVDPSMHSLSEIVGVLQGKGLTAAQALMLFGDAAGPGMFAVVQKGQAALETLTTSLENSEGSAKKLADALMKGLPGAVEKMKGSVSTALIAMAKAMEPSLLMALDLIEQLANFVTGTVIPAFASLPGPVQTATIVAAGFAAALGPVLVALGAVAASISALTGMLPLFTTATVGATAATNGAAVAATGLGIAIRGMLGPIGLAISALGLLYAASQKYHIARGRTIESLETEIESLKKVGGAMALSRAKSLEDEVAKLKAAKATEAAAGANDDLSAKLKTARDNSKGLVPSIDSATDSTKEQAKAAKEAAKATAEWASEQRNMAGMAWFEADAAAILKRKVEIEAMVGALKAAQLAGRDFDSNAMMGAQGDGSVTAGQALEQSRAFFENMKAVSEFHDPFAGMLPNLGKVNSLLSGMNTGLKGLWQGISSGNGLGGVFANLGKGLMDGFGALLSGGLTSLVNVGVSAAMKGLSKLGSWIGGLFGGKGKKTNDFRDNAITEYLGVGDLAEASDQLRQMGIEAGVTDREIRAVFEAKTIEDFQRAFGHVTDRIEEFKQQIVEAKDVMAEPVFIPITFGMRDPNLGGSGTDMFSPSNFATFDDWLKNWVGRNPGDENRANEALGGHQFALGGIATGPTFGVFGERGPEALVPLDRYDAMQGRSDRGDSSLLGEIRDSLGALRRDFKLLPTQLTAAAMARG